MPKLTIAGIEKKIEVIEEFEVTIRHLNGKDVSAVKQRGLRRYPFNKAAPSDKTVAKWKLDRFKKTYPEFDVDVYCHTPRGGKRIANGRMQLVNVRDSYA